MTAIEWTDRTWNPVTGCDRTSPGCDHCYALTMAARLKAMGQPHYQADGDPHTSGPGFALTCHPDTLDAPLHWRKPRRVFVNSMSDLFHKDVPAAFIAEVFATMALASHHTFQVLTKRPQRMAQLVADDGDPASFVAAVESVIMRDHPTAPLTEDGDAYLIPGTWDHDGMAWPLPNVWLGTSIEFDRYAWRADHLRGTPAAVRFLSLEPLLGPLPSLDLTGIDWVIVGGESGPGARPMHPDWVRDIRDRCVAAGIPFLFKQWGAWAPNPDNFRWNDDGSSSLPMLKLGKKAAGRDLDGRTWDEYPGGAA